jgi:hypothetical protein
MPFLRRAVAFALAMLACSNIAWSEERSERTVYVSVGREARLTYFASPDSRCAAGPPPEITIVEKPSYGKITVRPDHILARPSSLPARSKACIGKFYDMAAIFYKPSPRFHGSDRMVVRVKFAAWPGGTPPTREEVIYISVR